MTMNIRGGTLKKRFARNRPQESAGRTGYSLVWVPSQRGFSALRLQPQKVTWPSLSALYSTGVNAVPLWLPSQNGWLFDLPQEHHQ